MRQHVDQRLQRRVVSTKRVLCVLPLHFFLFHHDLWLWFFGARIETRHGMCGVSLVESGVSGSLLVR